MKACQIIIAISFLAGFLFALYQDVNGKKAKEPEGFRGIIITLMIYTALAFIYFKAGAFSTLLQ